MVEAARAQFAVPRDVTLGEYRPARQRIAQRAVNSTLTERGQGGAALLRSDAISVMASIRTVIVLAATAANLAAAPQGAKSGEASHFI